MKLLCTLFFALILFSAKSQSTIPNGGFENWTSFSFEELDDYVTEPGLARSILDTAVTTKSSDRFDGNYSIRLETKTNGVDTLFGFFTSGEFETENGFPYSQNPDSIVGYYKSEVQTGDTAIMIVRFSKLGVIDTSHLYSFVGTQNTWKRFAFPTGSSQLPDSAFLGAASSNAINEVGITPGSWLMLDSLHFVGTGITQKIPNGNFENWTTETYEDPDSWQTFNAETSSQKVYTATKTTDSHGGSFALRLETIEVFDDTIGFITNGGFGNGPLEGGVPFTQMSDTLIGYYKYSPSGLDTAALSLEFFINGIGIGQTGIILTSQSNYTEFKLGFSLGQAPDTLRINMSSSIVETAGIGSVLFMDSLIMSSIITSLDKNSSQIKGIELYPNPTPEILQIKFEAIKNPLKIDIIDALGRLYQSNIVANGEQQIAINLSALKRGTYFARFKVGNEVVHRSFVKQ